MARTKQTASKSTGGHSETMPTASTLQKINKWVQSTKHESKRKHTLSQFQYLMQCNHIQIVTDRPATKIITVIRDTSRPMKDVVLSQQQNAAAAQAGVESKQRSARNKKAQLEKKHKRNPPKDKK